MEFSGFKILSILIFSMEFFNIARNELKLVEQDVLASIPKEPHAVYGLLPEFFLRGGKRIRPTLVIVSAMATGGNVKNVVPLASAVEIFHNFTLIHDDIEDSSEIRRGKPTLNQEYGIPIALNSGDALYTLLWGKLASMEAKYGADETIKIQKKCAAAFRRVVEGQGIELAWNKNHRFDISEKDYMEMVAGKPGALSALSCEVGACSGTDDAKICEAMRTFGELLGVAFQIRDDVLNLVGDFDNYKKEIGGDVREGKRTLIVIKTFESATKEEREKLIKILDSGKANKNEIDYAISLFKKYGAIGYANKKAEEMVGWAKTRLTVLKPSAARSALEGIADFAINRIG